MEVPAYNPDNKQKQSPATYLKVQKRQNRIIKRLKGAIYSCDGNGYIKFYNKAAAELWGREPEIGKDMWSGSWKIFELDGVTPIPFDCCPMAIAIKEGRSIRGKIIILERPNGERRNILHFPDPIFNDWGIVTEAVNMMVDVTGIKHKKPGIKKLIIKIKAPGIRRLGT